MKFSSRLWQKINPFYHDIVNHPFNVELADGTLSKERFDFYIRQDVSYLRGLGKVFSLIAKRANSVRMINQFISYSEDAFLTGRDLHALFLDSSELSFAPSPACRDYSNYLIKTATSASLEESIAAVLPCFWIYRELSRKMEEIAKLSNPYLQWITMNASQEYSDMTDEVIALVDENAGHCTEKALGQMEEVCVRSSQFEWRFWDDAYKMLSCT